MVNNFLPVNDNNFAEVIHSQEKVLILFSSLSCGQCVQAKRNLRLALENIEQFGLYECKVEDAEETVKKYNVSGVPQIRVFQNGEPIYTAFGAVNAQDLYYDLKML